MGEMHEWFEGRGRGGIELLGIRSPIAGFKVGKRCGQIVVRLFNQHTRYATSFPVIMKGVLRMTYTPDLRRILYESLH